MLTVGSCFSGIGGIELGLEWTGGFKTRWQIEIDPYARKVLKKHWPNVRRFRDVRSVDIARLEPVDLICGGYPCQPFSMAGKRKGTADKRNLWPDMLRIIRVLRPRFVLLENVPGHLSMGFGRVLGDLAECGYDAEWGVLSAAGVGAPHLRKRVFIIAYSESEQIEREGSRRFQSEPSQCGEKVAHPSRELLDRSGRERDGRPEPSNGGWWAIEPKVGRMANGAPSRVDRLKCLGNAVVPRVAQKIGKMIFAYDKKNIKEKFV